MQLAGGLNHWPQPCTGQWDVGELVRTYPRRMQLAGESIWGNYVPGAELSGLSSQQQQVWWLEHTPHAFQCREPVDAQTLDKSLRL